MTTPTAREALQRLREGNRRFVENVRSVETLIAGTRRAALVEGQRPSAIVLGCSDSRIRPPWPACCRRSCATTPRR